MSPFMVRADEAAEARGDEGIPGALRRMRSQMAYDIARSTFADREALASWISAYPVGPFAPEEPALYTGARSPSTGDAGGDK